MRMDFPISPISGTASVPDKRKYVPVRVDRRRGARIILTRAPQRIEAESLYSVELVQKTLDCWIVLQQRDLLRLSSRMRTKVGDIPWTREQLTCSVKYSTLPSLRVHSVRVASPYARGAHSRYSTVGTG
jgi:hypothetical protein